MIFQASRGVPRTINLLCDAALVYGFGYELETIDVPVVEQVIKDKDGMGLTPGAENKKDSFSVRYEPENPLYLDRLQRLEDELAGTRRRVDDGASQMEKLEGKIKDFQASLATGL